MTALEYGFGGYDIVNSLKEFLLRDVGNENESGRAAFILRVASLGLSVYYAVFTVLLFIFGQFHPAILPFLCSLLMILILNYTYHRRTSLSLKMFYVSVTVWIILAVYFFGWDCGIQHLAFVLLLFIFTTSYISMKKKSLYGLLVYALRMGLYYFTLSAAPKFPLEAHEIDILQILDTTMVYLLLILIMSVFADDTLRAEGKLAKANKKLNMLADTDPLTKLPNRRYVLRHIEECVSDSENPLCPTIAIGDIDFFKKVNDTYGHDAGDRVLEVLSELFRDTMEPYGVCARWGGEEFLFFFEHLNLDNASLVLSELLYKIRVTSIPFGEEQLHVTLTFGIEDAMLSAKTPEELKKQIEEVIRIADEKLYMGKQRGRNQIVM